MPYADKEKAIGHMKLWRKKKMDAGYGKWLYARRKLRFEDAERFRKALEIIVSLTESRKLSLETKVVEANFYARASLQESRKAEEELGPFNGSE